MKTSTSTLVLSAFTLASNVQAQSIPPACEQWISAVEICTQNAISYIERADPANLKGPKELLQQMQENRVQVRNAVAAHGYGVIAERCAGPAFIKGMNNVLSGIVTNLSFNHALGKECKRKVQEIQVK